MQWCMYIISDCLKIDVSCCDHHFYTVEAKEPLVWREDVASAFPKSSLMNSVVEPIGYIFVPLLRLLCLATMVLLICVYLLP